MTTTVTASGSGPFTANGVTPIPFTFQSLSSDEIEVVRAGVVVAKSTYTVSRNDDGSGSITPTSSWGSDSVIIRSAPTYQQLTNFSRFGVFYPDQINPTLDRLARTIIALRGEVAALRARIDECCGDTPPSGTLYFPATGFWNDAELWADTALWKDA